MPTIIKKPTRIKSVGSKPKKIDEFVGRVNSSTEHISIAKMKSPAGWEELGQTPNFDEYTIVLRGLLRVETKDKTYDVKAGEGIITFKGEWIKYSTPIQEGAEYIEVCIPAFSPEQVNRD